MSPIIREIVLRLIESFETIIDLFQDICSKFTAIDSSYCHINIIDTPGLDDYEVVVQHALSDADGFIIAFSRMDYDSFRRVRLIHGLLSKVKGLDGMRSIPVALVATKSDLDAPKTVAEDEARSLAMDLQCDYFQCSAKSGINIEAPFVKLVRMLRDKKPESEPSVPLPSAAGRSQSLKDMHPPAKDMLGTAASSDKLQTM